MQRDRTETAATCGFVSHRRHHSPGRPIGRSHCAQTAGCVSSNLTWGTIPSLVQTEETAASRAARSRFESGGSDHSEAARAGKVGTRLSAETRRERYPLAAPEWG